jgi:7-keto-8-aminopelargonate synthetase-like enzyme
VAGPEPVIHYVKHHARSLIFSAAIPPARRRGAAALDVLESEPGCAPRLMPQRAQDARRLKRSASGSAPSETRDHPGHRRRPDAHVPVLEALFEGGAFTNPVTIPAPCRRMESDPHQLHGTHTDEQLDRRSRSSPRCRPPHGGLIGGAATVRRAPAEQLA